MRIKVFKEEKEYYSNKDFSYDFFVTYFTPILKPKHNVPILWLITSYDAAKARGYSSYAATIGWTQPNFPEVTEEGIEQLCKDYLDNKLDLGMIPPKFRNHISNKVISLSESAPSYVADMRYSICSKCPLFKDDICMACGCHVCNKTKIASESCPERKWGKYFQEVINPTKPTQFDGATRHLIYYLWDSNPTVVSYHIDKIARSVDLFNGRRIATLINGSANTYKAFNKYKFHIITGENGTGEYPAESKYFHQMMSMLPQDGITFYGHGKGASYKDFNGPIKQWTDHLYNSCLFGYTDHFKILENNIFSGAMLRTSRKVLVYPGTFFWFKNKDVFDLNWQLLDNSYGGVEYWPGKITNNRYMGVVDTSNSTNDFLELYTPEYWANNNKGKASKSCGCKK